MNKFWVKPFSFYLITAFIVLLSLLKLDANHKPNLTDLIVEGHGLLFDLIVFGIIFSLYEAYRSKMEKIEQYDQLQTMYVVHFEGMSKTEMKNIFMDCDENVLRSICKEVAEPRGKFEMCQAIKEVLEQRNFIVIIYKIKAKFYVLNRGISIILVRLILGIL